MSAQPIRRAAMSERDIVYETGRAWVLRRGATFVVFVAGLTHSVSDSTYADKSLAVARADYLARSAQA
jgi:hypothetical protein